MEIWKNIFYAFVEKVNFTQSSFVYILKLVLVYVAFSNVKSIRVVAFRFGGVHRIHLSIHFWLLLRAYDVHAQSWDEWFLNLFLSLSSAHLKIIIVIKIFDVTYIESCVRQLLSKITIRSRRLQLSETVFIETPLKSVIGIDTETLLFVAYWLAVFLISLHSLEWGLLFWTLLLI